MASLSEAAPSPRGDQRCRLHAECNGDLYESPDGRDALDSAGSRLNVLARLSHLATEVSNADSGAFMTHPGGSKPVDGPDGEVKFLVDGIKRGDSLP
jgi:hypothetical protein